MSDFVILRTPLPSTATKPENASPTSSEETGETTRNATETLEIAPPPPETQTLHPTTGLSGPAYESILRDVLKQVESAILHRTTETTTVGGNNENSSRGATSYETAEKIPESSTNDILHRVSKRETTEIPKANYVETAQKINDEKTPHLGSSSSTSIASTFRTLRGILLLIAVALLASFITNFILAPDKGGVVSGITSTQYLQIRKELAVAQKQILELKQTVNVLQEDIKQTKANHEEFKSEVRKKGSGESQKEQKKHQNTVKNPTKDAPTPTPAPRQKSYSSINDPLPLKKWKGSILMECLTILSWFMTAAGVVAWLFEGGQKTSGELLGSILAVVTLLITFNDYIHSTTSWIGFLPVAYLFFFSVLLICVIIEEASKEEMKRRATIFAVVVFAYTLIFLNMCAGWGFKNKILTFVLLIASLFIVVMLLMVALNDHNWLSKEAENAAALILCILFSAFLEAEYLLLHIRGWFNGSGEGI